MPEEKGFGSKLVGLFIQTNEQPEEETDESPTSSGKGEKSAAEVVAELAGSSAPNKKTTGPTATASAAKAAAAPPVVLPKVDGPVTPAAVDFDAVFKSAGMDVNELDRVRKAEELLKTLPESTPHEVKRQIVEASLKAFGVDITKISGAADNQLKALDTFVRVNEQQTAKTIAEAQAQIQSLEDKVINLRVDIDKKTMSLAQTSAAAQLRKTQVSSVLAFFQSPNPPKP